MTTTVKKPRRRKNPDERLALRCYGCGILHLLERDRKEKEYYQNKSGIRILEEHSKKAGWTQAVVPNVYADPSRGGVDFGRTEWLCPTCSLWNEAKRVQA